MAKQYISPGAVVLGSDFKALGVARSLGRRGVPIIVVDNTPRSAWYSRYVMRRLPWSGAMEGEGFRDFLLEAAREYALDGWILFPMQDEAVEFVARHHDALAATYQLATQGWDVLRWACDKRLTHRLAAEAGVPYPRTWYPAAAADLERLDIAYPVIVKPAISVRLQYATRLKALPARTLDELRAQYAFAAGIIPADEIMIQETIPGAGRQQFSVAAYCREGEPLVRMTARRTRQYPIDYGLGSSFVEAVEVPELYELAEALLHGMRVTGMVEVEFKQDVRDGRYKLLDINVRPWGWHTLGRACGLDFPYIQYRDLTGQPVAPAAPRYGAHWVRMLTDIPAGISEVRAGRITPISYVRSLAGRTEFSVFDWRDPVPAFGDVGSAVSRAVGGRLKRKASA